MPPMKLAIDAGRCAGHGRCYAMAPGLLEPDELGFVAARGTTVEVPAGSEQAARDAAAWCPEAAIDVES
jgi:ferredoxin